jgi:hypothetical protein
MPLAVKGYRRGVMKNFLAICGNFVPRSSYGGGIGGSFFLRTSSALTT